MEPPLHLQYLTEFIQDFQRQNSKGNQWIIIKLTCKMMGMFDV